MNRIPGVVTGTVIDLDDPQGEGRVQVQFQWLSESERSSWAPIATPLAGPQRGQFFMPEIDDEVLVAFLHGNFDHPYVIGFLWNGVDTPPETDTQMRIIKTPGGHELRFEDQDAAKKIVIKSSSGHEITLDDSPAGQNVKIETSLGQRIVLDDKLQSIEIHGGGRTIGIVGGVITMS